MSATLKRHLSGWTDAELDGQPMWVDLTVYTVDGRQHGPFRVSDKWDDWSLDPMEDVLYLTRETDGGGRQNFTFPWVQIAAVQEVM